jgi:hypothetical protein
MTKAASPKTLVRRGTKIEDLPIVVHRRRWAAAIAMLLVPVVLALAALLAYAGVGAMPEFIAEGAKKGAVDLGWSLIGAAAWIMMIPLCLIASFLGIDRSFEYHLAIERDGLRLKGELTDRLLVWKEISEIRLKPRVFIPALDIYQVAHIAIYVDGTIHPRRHWSSLWFGYYDIPPLMECDSKELTALLRHAKRRADLGWPDSSHAK